MAAAENRDSTDMVLKGPQLLHEVQGDLFKCPKDWSIAHCVSKDLRMGKGIAVIFRKKFNGVSDLLKQHRKVGEVAVLQREGRFIYYLITKERYCDKPTYDDLKRSLTAMKVHCEANMVKDLAMPRIGCGLDKLEWNKVQGILRMVFDGSNINVVICTM